jgi:hypothetical protein
VTDQSSFVRPLARSTDLVVREFDGETLVYDLATKHGCTLDEAAARIWEACDGATTVAAIAEAQGCAVETVWLAVEGLRTAGLLVDSTVESSPYRGMSRRQMMKTFGVIVAAPTIVAIAIPTAASAQSTNTCGCQGNNNAFSSDGGCACNSNNDCCTNICGAGGMFCAAGSPAGGAAGCCGTTVCPPANQTNLPPGCLCNVGGPGTCASGVCSSGICAA